jgi:uncharacterized protein (TIGR02271 family)
VLSADGIRGVVDTTPSGPGEDRAELRIRLEDGRLVTVPAELLQRQEDGSYYLPVNLNRLEGEPPSADDSAQGVVARIPVIAETLDVQKRHRKKGVVHVTKRVHEHEEVVDEAGFEEDAEVERVPVNRYVDGPVDIRQEGDTLVIPLVEEVLVVEKRLVLREEVRVTKRRREVRHPERVTLRREEAVVERTDVTADERGESE